jgi:hypothetical protein
VGGHCWFRCHSGPGGHRAGHLSAGANGRAVGDPAPAQRGYLAVWTAALAWLWSGDLLGCWSVPVGQIPVFLRVHSAAPRSTAVLTSALSRHADLRPAGSPLAALRIHRRRRVRYLRSREHSQRAERPAGSGRGVWGQCRFPLLMMAPWRVPLGPPFVRVQVLDEGGADGAQRQRPGIGVAVDVAGVGEDVPSGLII